MTDSDLTTQQFALLGTTYPSHPKVARPVADTDPEIIVQRQVRMTRALGEIAHWRPARPFTFPASLPINQAKVAAWVADDPMLRGGLSEATATGLAYLDTFRRAV